MERVKLGRRGFMAALGFGVAAAPMAGQSNAVQRQRDEAHLDWLRETSDKLWPSDDN